MSIVTSIEARRRAYPGYDEPNFPLWSWAQAVFVVGDASGGNRTASIVFATGAGPKVSLLWSLEQISAFDTDNNSKNIDLMFEGFDHVVGTSLYRLSLGDGVQMASIPLQNYPQFPLWLGGHANQGSPAQINLVAANINAEVLAFNAQGYVWGSRSASIPGGPQRPSRGLYSP